MSLQIEICHFSFYIFFLLFVFSFLIKESERESVRDGWSVERSD